MRQNAVLHLCFCVSFIVPMEFLVVGSVWSDEPTIEHNPKSKQPVTQWGNEVVGVKCSIGTDAKDAKFVAGEQVRLTCRTLNGGRESVTIVRSHLLSMFTIKVTGPLGKPIPMSLYGQQQMDVASAAGESFDELDSGKEERTRLHLNRLFDLSEEGKYRVSFSRAVLVPNGVPKTVTSNEITVLVVEPEAEK